MANKALKGLTIKIGGDTSELLDSLKDVEKKGSDLSKELGQINKLLKLDPKNTQLLAQKQKVLADAVSNTEEKLDKLKAAEKRAQEQFEKGEISEEQYRALQREVIETERKLDSYKKAVKETTDAQERLADGAEDAAEELDDQADKTRDADNATEDLDDSADSLAAGGLAAMAAAATAAVTAIVALAEETREYRNEMAKLDTAFKDNSFSSEAATKTYEELQSVLGETEQAVEAATLLSALAKNEEDLAEWTDIATGVYAKFGASLPVEGLIEAANETVRVGQVTGPLADALNWAAKEGETFGVKLKDNIKFTEYTSAALATLTDKQKAEYEARKKQYEEIEEYNQRVKEAASAEDKFNLALEQCTNEQERQELITSVLTETYGEAATQFKKTNKEVIASNKATEKWNKATAKIGKTVEPVITDVKELGVTLLEDVEEPLVDTAEYIQSDVLPAIQSTSKWAKSNLPAIKAGVAGVAAAMVALKVATIATAVAQKGLKTSLMATAVAQKALNLVQAASPWGLVAAGITAAVVALVAYTAATKKAKPEVDALTKEERELMAAADEAAEAFREQKDAMDEDLKSITAQMDHVEDLVDELDDLADASGKVKKTDQDRAQFILNELNKALGTEYEMVDGVIVKYKELKKNIDEVIKSKKANLLLEAAEGAYTDAITKKADAWDNLILKEKDYKAQLDATNQAQADAAAALETYRDKVDELGGHAAQSYYWLYYKAEEAYEKEKGILADKESAYGEAQSAYELMVDNILAYEAASEAALAGNYDTTVDLLAKKGGAYVDYSAEVDAETAKVLTTLETEAREAGEKAEWTKEQFEKGVKGFTKEMVTEAEEGYKEALGKFGSAYSDAYGLGEDFGQGIADGIKIKDGAVGAAAIAQIREAVKAAKKAAEIKSPSRVARREIGAQLGEGNKLGIEDTTPDVEQAARHQIGAILDAYRAEEVGAQKALRHVAEQQTARQVNTQMAAAGSSAPLLKDILAAIEQGQILTIDGDTLVGATSNKMDSALGRRRALAARGAI
jgi:predicted  nucleic acid-binding Zn-ribbon protein